MAPNYGSRLLPVVVDELAKEQPDLVYAKVPLTTNISDGFRDFTFADIASATNRVAAWIDSTFGRSANFGTIAYMGLGDLRYVVVFLAAVKCGYKVLLPSLRNSAWMNASLLEQTESTVLLYAPEVEALVKPLLEHRPSLRLHPIQALETLIQPNTPHYPYTKTFEEARWDPILVLHSSGSTGAPRPIQMYHTTFAVGDNDRNLPTVPGRVNQNWSLWDFPQKEHFFSPFPAFHLAGFSSMVLLPIYYSNSTLVLSPPTRPPTGHVVSEIMEHVTLKSIFCPPIIAEQLVQEPGGIEKCKSLKFILYAGGPLSQAAGDALSKVTDVCQFYGQTETGAIQALVPLRENWANLEWHPAQEAVMEPSIDGTFEMVMHRNPALVGVRSVSCNFPDVDVWRTKDLFRPVAGKPGQWRFHGRTDDIIVLSNGEKFNPVPSETQIAAHPLVAGALIIGNNYPQAALVLELKDSSQDHATAIQEVWPAVEKANAQAPAHGKITMDKIVVASKDQVFERSPKGTVVRGSTGKKFEDQIANLFAKDVVTNVRGITLNPPYSLASISQFLKDTVAIAFKGHSVGDHDDLFVFGLDSLQTSEIISMIKAGILSGKSDQDVSWVTPKLVYSNPSIQSLSEALYAGLTSSIDDFDLSGPQAFEARKKKMAATVERFTKNLPERVSTSSSANEQRDDLHVLLTGSTGSLGTQILLQLLQDSRISRVTCLDRSANALERITTSLSTWAAPPHLDTSRVSFLQADYSKPDFGLAASTFQGLVNTVNVIIHNAWKVDFNHSLASFEAVHIRGVRNLIDFSAASPLHPRIAFISSISSVGNWHQNPRADSPAEADSPQRPATLVVPEKLPESPTAAQGIGYAESKAVSEQILGEAARTSGIPASIIRIGQIAGPASPGNGAVWNEHEWFPLLVKTAKSLGQIPDESFMNNIDWTPVDVAAATVLDLSLPAKSQPRANGVHAAHVAPLNVYHLLNPSPVPWSTLLPSLLPLISAAFPPSAVPLREWLAALDEVDAQDAKAVAAAPAVKILDFFKDVARDGEAIYIGASGVRFATDKAAEGSRALREVGGVRAEWLEMWMKGWGF